MTRQAPTDTAPAATRADAGDPKQAVRDTPDLSAIMALLRTLWLYRAVFTGVVLLVLVIAGFAAASLTPSFRASTELLLTKPRTAMQSDGTPVVGPARPRTDLASEIEVITSRDLLSDVVRAQGLTEDPHFGPAPPSAHPVLVALGLRAAPDRRAARAPEATIAATVDSLRKNLTVRPLGQSHVIEIGIEAPDPDTAATVANALVDTYLTARARADEQSAAQATQGLRRQVAELRASLEAAERKAARYRRDAGLLESGGKDVVTRRIATLTDKLSTARAQSDEARARLEQLETALHQQGPLAAADTVDSDTIRELQIEESRLQRRRAELDTTYGPRHPKMQTVVAEIQRQRSAIADAVHRLTARARDTLGVARRRVRDLRARLDSVRGRAADMKERAVRLNELERRVAVERRIYETLLGQLKRRAAGALDTRPLARVISRAEPPRAPASPNLPLLMGLALLGALPAGTAAALLRAQLDSGVANREEAETATGLATLAAVPETTSPGHPATPANHILDRPGGRFADAIRRLASGVKLARARTTPRSLLVTSADTREGKSTVALALARLLAQQGESVLLIEADLRKPQLRATLRQRGRMGLADVLRGDCAIDSALRLDPRSPLQVLHAGRAGPGTTGLLDGPGMETVLAAAGEHYDRIVIDAPPVLLVHEAVQLARLADVTVMCLRWRGTRPGSADRALAELRRAGADVVGLALTRVNPRRYGEAGDGDEVAYGAAAQGYYGV